MIFRKVKEINKKKLVGKKAIKRLNVSRSSISYSFNDYLTAL